MSEDRILTIAQLCLAIDKRAVGVYNLMANAGENQNLTHFWRQMSAAEQKHLAFWNGVQTIAEGHPLPEVFDDPLRIEHELKELLERINLAVQRWEKEPGASEAFVLAFRLELAMTHRAFIMFYQTLGPMVNAANPIDDYSLHLDQFLQMAAWYAHEKPELELLGETLKSLWETNTLMTQLVALDGLTGLLNRQGSLALARQLAYLAQRNKGHVGVLIIRLDDLYAINERYGLNQGDLVLQGVSSILRDNLRRSDVVGRYSSQEFIVFFPAIQPDAVGQLAEQLRFHIETGKPSGIQVTASIGAAHGKMLLDPPAELDRLIAQAARCFREIKPGETNRVVFGG